MTTETNNCQLPDYQEILYKNTFRFSVISVIVLAVISCILILISYHSDIFFKTNFFDVKQDPSGTFNIVSDNTYNGTAFDLTVKSFHQNGNAADVVIVLTNNLAYNAEYKTDDFQIFKYIDNNRDMRMTFYPVNYEETYILAPGETITLFLTYNMIDIESKSGTTTYCVAVNNPLIPEKVTIIQQN